MLNYSEYLNYTSIEVYSGLLNNIILHACGEIKGICQWLGQPITDGEF